MTRRNHRSIFWVSLSSSALAAITSDGLYPSQPFSPDELLRTISASLLVANSFSFFTDSSDGGAKSPVAGSELACCDFLDPDKASSSLVDTYSIISTILACFS